MNLIQKAKKVAASGLAISVAMMSFAFAFTASAAPHSNGCLVNVNGTVYLIDNGQKRGFTSAEVFMSHGYNFGQVVTANSDDAALSTGSIIIYADGTLVKGPNDPLVYLVVNGQKRGFTSGSVFTGLGYSFANIQWAPVNTFNDIPTGANIDSTTITGLPMSGPGPKTVNCSMGSGSGDLSGGAGSVDSYNLISDLGNEEVGEGDNDVEVAGLEIEADDGSDLDFTAVRLVFTQGTAGSDFEDYVDEVSVWFDGNEVAREDGDEFNDDNDWTKTVSLDGAILDAGETGELVVAISAIGNLDSGDVTDTWTVDFRQVRFMDADGAVVSEDPATGVVTFSFENFATAADTELVISDGADSDEVNDAHVINIHATEETDDVEILSFNIEIEGDSDVTLDSLPITVTVGGAQDNVDEMIGALTLTMDGDEVGSASIGSDCGTDADCVSVGTAEDYNFDDLDLTLEAGEDYEFVVMADIYGITDTGDVAAGDTISAKIAEDVETDDAQFDAEDEEGNQLVDADKTGSVTGSASEVRDIGINVEFVSSDASVEQGEVLVISDVGTFEITFDVTPFDGDAFIDLTAPDLSGGATESDLAQGGTAAGTLTCDIAGISGFTTGTDGYQVEENETGRFTITCDLRDGATDLVDGFTWIELDSVLYALTDVDGTTEYNFDMGDYKTPSVYLDDQGF